MATDTVVDRLRRIRDMLVGKEPSELTKIKEAVVRVAAEVAAVKAQLDRIEADLNETKATTLGGTASEIPKP